MGIRDSSAGHGREDRDLARARDRRIATGMNAIDGYSHGRGLGESIRVFRSAALEPLDQGGSGGDAGRHVEFFLGAPDPLPYPGEVEELHSSSPMTWRRPARK